MGPASTKNLASRSAAATMTLPPHLADASSDEASLRRFLFGLPGVDPVGLEQRAAGLATRSIKKASKLAAIDLAISMVDLTTLEGADTPGKVRNLARKAMLPDPDHPDTPRTAAVCVYPDMVPTAVEELRGLRGQGRLGGHRLPVRPVQPRRSSSPTPSYAVDAGADEIDMVIDRGRLPGRPVRRGLRPDRRRSRQACGSARLKVILETGELGTYDNVRRASWLALLAGGDFIKTSTGKISPAATLPVTHVMLQAVKDWKTETGEQRAVKPAGGIRTAKDAIRYLVAVHEVAGPEWLDPYYFRFGASSVLNDLIMQRRAQLDGHYSGADYVTVD